MKNKQTKLAGENKYSNQYKCSIIWNKLQLTAYAKLWTPTKFKMQIHLEQLQELISFTAPHCSVSEARCPPFWLQNKYGKGNMNIFILGLTHQSTQDKWLIKSDGIQDKFGAG